MKAALIAAIVAAVVAASSAGAARIISRGLAPNKVTTATGLAWPIAPNESREADADCPVGDVATGGGGDTGGGSLVSSLPVVRQGNSYPTQWAIVVSNQTDQTIDIQASVVCVAR